MLPQRREIASRLPSWVARWGFAVLVAVGALTAAYAAWRTNVPAAIPDFALKAEAVYRIEVGAGTFLGFYLVMMALVLALNNRGFTDIGFDGLKAQDIASKAQQEAMRSQGRSAEALRGMVSEIGASTETTFEELRRRLDALESQAPEKTPPAGRPR